MNMRETQTFAPFPGVPLPVGDVAGEKLRMGKRLFLSLLCLLCLPLCLAAEEWGIVNVSVTNTRERPAYSSGQESQALLGMPVRVTDRMNEWLQVETPDAYVAWTLGSTVKRVSREELTAWNTAPQVVVTALYAQVYSQRSTKSAAVSDVVGGDRLRLVGRRGKYFHVAFPDGREGFLHRSACQPIDEWRNRLKADAQSILHTARSLTGVPYMWGGTSPKGVDCSGFVRTTLYLHDIIIPRNASQQARTGERLEIAPDFSNLVPGDLLFFGSRGDESRPERVVHVAFYVGDGRFIHSSGFVREASLRPGDPDYDDYNRGRLLFAARVLPYINRQEGLFTTHRHPFYQ